MKMNPLKKLVKNETLFFLLPGSLMLLFLIVIPLFLLLATALYTEGEISLERLSDLLADKVFRTALLNTLRIALKTTFICALLGIPTGYFISRANGKAKRRLTLLILFPLLVNAVVRSLSWMIILGKKGILNAFWQNLPFINEPLSILYTENAIVIGTTYIFLPLMAISIIGVMDNIPRDIEEVAYSLGASQAAIFFRVVLPLAAKGISVGAILVLSASLTAYTTPQLLGSDKVLVLATLIRQKGITLGQWESVASIALYMLIVATGVVTCLTQLANLTERRGGTHA